MTSLHRAFTALAMFLVGCSDPVTAPPQDAATDAAADVTADVTADAGKDAGEDVPIVPVAFREVQALFTRTCAMPACHGRGADGGGGSGGLFLTDETTSHRAMVDQPSDQVARLRLVAPGDPDNSYLMVKIEGTMRNFAECAPSPGRNPCGVQMPQLAGPLSAAERALVRNWIRAGAPTM